MLVNQLMSNHRTNDKQEPRNTGNRQRKGVTSHRFAKKEVLLEANEDMGKGW